jgi:hypothetical protein
VARGNTISHGDGASAGSPLASLLLDPSEVLSLGFSYTVSGLPASSDGNCRLLLDRLDVGLGFLSEWFEIDRLGLAISKEGNCWFLSERLDTDRSGLGERKYVRESSGDMGPESRLDVFDELLEECSELDKLLL